MHYALASFIDPRWGGLVRAENGAEDQKLRHEQEQGQKGSVDMKTKRTETRSREVFSCLLVPVDETDARSANTRN